MDVVSKTFTRVAQNILIKQETTSATILMAALANATTNSKEHVQKSTQDARFILNDLNELLTLAKRINTSWIGGTPTTRTKGITDLLCSPEVVEDLRAMAYNPINSVAADGGAPANTEDGIPAPDSIRDALYKTAGLPEFYGISIMELNELGANQRFTDLFTAQGGTYERPDGSGGEAFEDGDDLVVGVDRSKDSLIRAVATDAESGSEFTLLADDQYSIRQNKIGYFGSVEEGRVVLDNRVLVGKMIPAA
jgi:hypothetical protein